MSGKVLITGACGLLGSHLMAGLSRQHDVVGVDRHPWWGDEPLEVLSSDLQAPGAVEQVIASAAPSIVIHCAALVNVDACEQDPSAAYDANALLTRRLVRALPPKSLMVYMSTDGVFQGDTPFLTEQEAPAPRTVYGRSKVQGEQEVAKATANHLIIRTNFYGWSSGRKTTAGEWLYQALDTGQPITLFTDFFFTPLYVADLAERIGWLVNGAYRGTLHLAGRDRLSKYDFGRLMAQAAGFSMDRVRQGVMKEMPSMAPRPRDMSLSSRRFVEVTGGEVPGARSGLQRFIADRRRPLSARFSAEAGLVSQ